MTLRIDSGQVGIVPLDAASLQHAVYEDGKLTLFRRGRGQASTIEGPSEILLTVAVYLRRQGVRVSGIRMLEEATLPLL